MPRYQKRYHLFRVETQHGGETFVIAEDEPSAAEIYSCRLVLGEGEHQLYRIFLWDDELTPSQLEEIYPFLLFGPPGVVKWCESAGWSVDPPG